MKSFWSWFFFYFQCIAGYIRPYDQTYIYIHNTHKVQYIYHLIGYLLSLMIEKNQSKKSTQMETFRHFLFDRRELSKQCIYKWYSHILYLYATNKHSKIISYLTWYNEKCQIFEIFCKNENSQKWVLNHPEEPTWRMIIL